MAKVETIIQRMRNNPNGIRLTDLIKVCDHYFGASRQKGSHLVYHTPWQGDPRINIQRKQDGNAKSYQVKAVIAAIDKLQE